MDGQVEISTESGIGVVALKRHRAGLFTPHQDEQTTELSRWPEVFAQSTMSHRTPLLTAGGSMTPLILTPRQRSELENLASRESVAKERCRALALLWLDEGETVEQVADSLRVSRRTVYYWVERLHERDGLDLRQRLTDAPRPGRPRTEGDGVDPWVAEIIDADPRILGYHQTVWTAPLLVRYLRGIIIKSRSRARRSAVPSHVWVSGGSGPVINSPFAPTRGGSQKGAQTRPGGRARTVLLMLDETIITETPPLYSCYGHVGEQVRVPITGNRAKRFLHGAINVGTGDVVAADHGAMDQGDPSGIPVNCPCPLAGLGPHPLRGSSVSAYVTREPRLGEELGIEVRLLPKATPELNAMDHLWRHTKREALGDRETVAIEGSALGACQYIIALSPRERLRKAGVLSGNFWLTT